MVSELSKNKKVKILKAYLGKLPAWYDSRKSVILKDSIDITQWQINMNYLVDRHGSISPLERQAFETWKFLKEQEDDNFYCYDFLESKVSPELIHIPEGDLAPILRSDVDRNWFLSAYPDVFDFFYPHENLRADDLDREFELTDERRKKSMVEHEKLIQHVHSLGEANQMVYLIRMKNYYHNVLNRPFLLSLQKRQA